MKNNNFKLKLIPLFLLLLVLLIMRMCSDVVSENAYNDGIHKGCGGHWVYEQAVGHRYSTCYLYHCDKCGMIYEFDERH